MKNIELQMDGFICSLKKRKLMMMNNWRMNHKDIYYKENFFFLKFDHKQYKVTRILTQKQMSQISLMSHKYYDK